MVDWYLMDCSTRPNMLGGYESEAFVDFKGDAFMELLTTEMASDAILYNSDLSWSQKIRCVIQNTTAESADSSFSRTVLLPIGFIRTGMYMYFEDAYWLVIGNPGNNKIYEKVAVVRCQYILRWQNRDGKIIERWAAEESYGKSPLGTANGQIIKLGTGAYTLTMPIDDETKLVTLDKRIPIDLEGVYEPHIYIVTGRQVKRNDCDLRYQGGTLEVTLTFDQFNLEKDKLVTLEDGRQVWIADYIEPSHETPEEPEVPSEPSEPLEPSEPSEPSEPTEPEPEPDPEPNPEPEPEPDPTPNPAPDIDRPEVRPDKGELKASIIYTGKPTIRMGGTAKKFSVQFHDDADSDKKVTWKIDNDTDGILVVDDSDNSITLQIADDDTLLEKEFTLDAYVESELVAYLTVRIVY